MAKKNYVKYLPKVGSTVAVAVAMTMALSTQASATELNEGDIHLDNNVLNNDSTDLNLTLSSTQPAEHNATVEQKNEGTVDKNEETLNQNEQTHQNNEAALEQNQDVPEGSLPETPERPEAPEVPTISDTLDDLDVPEAPTLPEEAPEVPEHPGEAPEVPEHPGETPETPEIPEMSEEIPAVPEHPGEAPEVPEVPNTDGMDVEDYNEAAGEYNEKVEDYNEAAGDYNEKVEDYNEAVEDYNDAAKDYNDAAGGYNDEVDDYNDAVADFNDAAKDYNDAVDDYNDAVEDFNDAAGGYNDEVDDYNDAVADYNDAAKDYNDKVEDYNEAVEDYNKDLGEYGDSIDGYNEAVKDYNEKVEDYNEKVDEYNKKVDEYNDAAEKLDEELEGQYKQDMEDYENAEDAHEQQLKENQIFGEVTEYNEQIEDQNEGINAKNEALENDLHAEAVANIDAVGEINDNVEIDDDVLNVLNSYDDLAKQHDALMDQADALEAHEGKNAELGSDAYAAYLAAVEAYNEAVADFNASAAAYNAAVEAYNAAVDTYNQNKPADSSSSTGIGTATSNKEADWGNIKTQGETVGHIDVKYNAAASQDVTYENGEPSYSTSVTGYDVTGVYANEAEAKDNPNKYGVSYQSNANATVKTQSMNPYGGYEFHAGNVNGINLDMASGKISFYATLEGEDGTENITVNLDANSVYADGSYYAVSNGGFLGDYRFGENKDQKLEIVTIDGVKYYDISGHSVYVISALTCDGMTKYNSGHGYGRTTVLDPWGLDLVLNLQTMIEIHQSANAQKINYANFELGKTARLYDPGNPGIFDEEKPQLQTTARLEKLSHLDKLDEKVVIDFGDPLNPLNPVDDLDPIDGVELIDTTIDKLDPIDVLDPVDTLDPIEKLDPVDTLDPMDLLDPPEPPVQPDPGPGPGPNPDPQPEPVVFDDDGLVIIDDGAVPLADVPKTGDASVVFGAMSAFSGFGLAFMQLFGRKKKEEN